MCSRESKRGWCESHDSYNTSTLAARAAVFVKTWFLGVRNRVFGLCVVFLFRGQGHYPRRWKTGLSSACIFYDWLELGVLGVQRPAFCVYVAAGFVEGCCDTFFLRSASGAEANGNKLALTLVIALYFPSLCDMGGEAPPTSTTFV